MRICVIDCFCVRIVRLIVRIPFLLRVRVRIRFVFVVLCFRRRIGRVGMFSCLLRILVNRMLFRRVFVFRILRRRMRLRRIIVLICVLLCFILLLLYYLSYACCLYYVLLFRVRRRLCYSYL